jgi:hypothetical protein
MFEELKSFDPYNAYQFDCKATKQRATYKLCLNIIQAETEKTRRGFESCAKCIGKATCPALSMIDEEISAGEPIYFIESSLREKYEGKAPSKEPTARHETKSDSYLRGRHGQDHVLETQANARAPQKGEKIKDYLIRLKGNANG